MGKEVVIVQFQALSWHLPATTKENQDKTSAGELVSSLRFKPGISSILNGIANHLKKKITSYVRDKLARDVHRPATNTV
jgi:hypothetical protein